MTIAMLLANTLEAGQEAGANLGLRVRHECTYQR